MKVRHPRRVGLPGWWRLAVWPMTAVGVLLLAEGVVGAVADSMIGLLLLISGSLLLVLLWANAIALGTTRPGWVTVNGALARQTARRFRYLAGFLALLGMSAAVAAALIARDSRLVAAPPTGGRGFAVALALLLSITVLLLALAMWLRARLIDSWA